jgi:tRNA A-37 threonylcarbamoyl transferase component Bud32
MIQSDFEIKGTVIRFDASVLAPMEPNLFDEAWLRSNHFWQGSTEGRSQAHFFHYAGRDMVLRHFYRGGLMARINRDLYLGLSTENSRSLREFDLLSEMHSEGLPVPLPVAARYVPLGPFYRADIITERIPRARPLQDVLGDMALSAQLWGAIGRSVRNLHNHGVFHSDLNSRNIIIDSSDRVWFIDFDKCEKRAPGAWMGSNLDRLLRSLRKHAAGSADAQRYEQGWADFLAGYASEAKAKD